VTSPTGSPTELRPWSGRDALLAVLAGLAGASVASVAVGRDPSALQLFGLVVPAQAAGTLIAVALLVRVRPDWRSALSVRGRWGDVSGLLVGAGLQIGVAAVAYWVVVSVFGGEFPTQEVVEAADMAVGGLEIALVVIGVVVLGPLAEELVFRGILLGALRRRRSDWAAILWSSAAFASLHLIDPNAWFAVPFLFVAGVVMGRAVVNTGRIARAIAIHAGFNLVSVLALVAA